MFAVRPNSFALFGVPFSNASAEKNGKDMNIYFSFSAGELYLLRKNWIDLHSSRRISACKNTSSAEEFHFPQRDNRTPRKLRRKRGNAQRRGNCKGTIKMQGSWLTGPVVSLRGSHSAVGPGGFLSRKPLEPRGVRPFLVGNGHAPHRS